MKITRLAALAKEHKSITLINTEAEGQIIRQHARIGNGVYPLDGFPLVDGEQLLTMLDVPLEKRMEYSVYIRDMWEGMQAVAADNHASDREASVIEAEVSVPWADMLSAYTQSGMVFINADYRKVIEKEKSVTWWSRTLQSGSVILVAKKGYQAIAAIMPEWSWLTEGLCDDLWHIAQAARNAFEKQKGGDPKHEQQTMHTDEDSQMLPDVRKLQAPILPGDE